MIYWQFSLFMKQTIIRIKSTTIIHLIKSPDESRHHQHKVGMNRCIADINCKFTNALKKQMDKYIWKGFRCILD